MSLNIQTNSDTAEAFDPGVTGESDLQNQSTVPSKGKPELFQKVKDSRGRPIRRLWRRNNRFYAQLRMPGKKNQAKVPLVNVNGAAVRTVPEAQSALQDLLVKRDRKALPLPGNTQTLGELIQSYLAWLRRSETKSPLTIGKEAWALAKWSQLFGPMRLAQFQRAHINEFVAQRKESDKVSNRTVNLDVLALINCLTHARDQHPIATLPTDSWKPLEHSSPRRPLWTSEQIELVCQKALTDETNGQLLVDYIRFLAWTGARRNEALAVEWSHLDWNRGLLTLNKTKFGRPRTVNLNPRIENHLKEMLVRRTDSKWLFPSPYRVAENDASAKNLQASLERARTAAGLSDFCFHDLRSYFISGCIMTGIDYLTIARWVGHRDGGVLIGKVYGHLYDEHSRSMAARLGSL